MFGGIHTDRSGGRACRARRLADCDRLARCDQHPRNARARPATCAGDNRARHPYRPAGSGAAHAQQFLGRHRRPPLASRPLAVRRRFRRSAPRHSMGAASRRAAGPITERPSAARRYGAVASRRRKQEMKPGPPSARNAGFTLVEALVATLLMAFILGALATVTAQWLGNWDRGFIHAQRVELLAAGLERVVADLAAAEIVSMGGGYDPPLFDGAVLSVTFVRTALGPNTSHGLEVVRIGETADSRGPALVRMTALFVPFASVRAADQLSF